jgi:DNA-binding GntR family transcriptional regulator
VEQYRYHGPDMDGSRVPTVPPAPALGNGPNLGGYAAACRRLKPAVQALENLMLVSRMLDTNHVSEYYTDLGNNASANPTGQAFQDYRVERSTLGSQIANSIRRAILFGQIPVGTRLGQQELCRRFGTSRMPVRDALRQLTYEGYLQIDGSRRSIVAPLSLRDLLDVYVIEGTLHGIAARRVAESAPMEAIINIVRQHEVMVSEAHTANTVHMAELNWNFHRDINHLAASPKLLAALRTLSLAIPRDYVVEFPQRIERANREHADIVAALTARDGDKAEVLMRAHVIEAGKGLVDYLQDKGVLQTPSPTAPQSQNDAETGQAPR